jgi:hypothetical protein
MIPGDLRSRPELSFHIGGPLLPNPLCGDRHWILLVHYDGYEAVRTDGLDFCAECVRIHLEQHSPRKDGVQTLF